jgi:hypothetical protein
LETYRGGNLNADLSLGVKGHGVVRVFVEGVEDLGDGVADSGGGSVEKEGGEGYWRLSEGRVIEGMGTGLREGERTNRRERAASGPIESCLEYRAMIQSAFPLTSEVYPKKSRGELVN